MANRRRRVTSVSNVTFAIKNRLIGLCIRFRLQGDTRAAHSLSRHIYLCVCGTYVQFQCMSLLLTISAEIDNNDISSFLFRSGFHN